MVDTRETEAEHGPTPRSGFEIAAAVIGSSGELDSQQRLTIVDRLGTERVPQAVLEVVERSFGKKTFQEEAVVALEAARAAYIVADVLVGKVSEARKETDLRQVYSLADRLCSQVIGAVLEERFPSYGRLDEESGRVNLGAQKCFVIDPIDGSAAYIRDLDTWAVGIALHDEADILAGGSGITWGIIASPQRRGREVIFGGRAQGSWDWEGNPVKVSQIVEPEKMSFSVGSRDVRVSDWIAALQALGKSVSRIYAGIDTQFAATMLARGGIDFLVRVEQPAYDIAPLIGIVEGAGGLVAELDGRPVVIKRDTERRHNIFAWNGTNEVRDYFLQINGYELDLPVVVTTGGRDSVTRGYDSQSRMIEVLRSGKKYESVCLLPRCGQKYLIMRRSRFGPEDNPRWDFPLVGLVYPNETCQYNCGPDSKNPHPALRRLLIEQGLSDETGGDTGLFEKTSYGLSCQERILPGLFFPNGGVNVERTYAGVLVVSREDVITPSQLYESRWVELSDLEALTVLGEQSATPRLRAYLNWGNFFQFPEIRIGGVRPSD